MEFLQCLVNCSVLLPFQNLHYFRRQSTIGIIASSQRINTKTTFCISYELLDEPLKTSNKAF